MTPDSCSQKRAMQIAEQRITADHQRMQSEQHMQVGIYVPTIPIIKFSIP